MTQKQSTKLVDFVNQKILPHIPDNGDGEEWMNGKKFSFLSKKMLQQCDTFEKLYRMRDDIIHLIRLRSMELAVGIYPVEIGDTVMFYAEPYRTKPLTGIVKDITFSEGAWIFGVKVGHTIYDIEDWEVHVVKQKRFTPHVPIPLENPHMIRIRLSKSGKEVDSMYIPNYGEKYGNYNKKRKP